jgi:hypothetical protein
MNTWGIFLASLPEAMSGFADIDDAVPPGWPLWWWLVAAATAALLAILFWWWSKRRPQQAAAEAAAPPVPPEQLARAALQQLANEQQELAAERFTVRLTDIVRDYLEAALRIPAREQTSEEFLASLQLSDRTLPPVLAAQMPRFLEACDRVKYAAQEISGEQRAPLLATATEVVDQTAAHISAQPAAAPPQPQEAA